MDRKYKKLNRGFTLVEILLYISISGIIVFSITAFFLTMLDARERSRVVNEVEQEGIQAMQYITQTIRNSTAVNSPNPGSSSAILQLTVPDAAKNPTFFYSVINRLRTNENYGADVYLSSPKIIVSGLNFANLAKDGTKGILRIQFMLSHINPENKPVYNYSKTFYGSASIR